MSLAFWPTVIATTAVTFGVLHLTARWQCKRKGHVWWREMRDRPLNGYAPDSYGLRCRRCRQWADT